MFKKSCFTVLCLALTLSTVAVAESDTGRSRNDRELVFGVRGLDNIGLTTYGGELGFRYFLGQRIALRPSFALSNSESRTPYYDETYTDDVRTEDEWAFDLILEHYLQPHDRLQPYWGLGYGYESDESEREYAVPIDPEDLFEGYRLSTKRTATTWSVLALLGIQWKINDSFRLGAEHKLHYYRRDLEDERVVFGLEKQTQETESSGLNSYTSSLYLAVRF